MTNLRLYWFCVRSSLTRVRCMDHGVPSGLLGAESTASTTGDDCRTMEQHRRTYVRTPDAGPLLRLPAECRQGGLKMGCGPDEGGYTLSGGWSTGRLRGCCTRPARAAGPEPPQTGPNRPEPPQTAPSRDELLQTAMNCPEPP